MKYIKVGEKDGKSLFQYQMKLSHEKTERESGLGGLYIPNEIGYLIQFWIDNVRPLFDKKNNDYALWLNNYGDPLSILLKI